MRKVFGLVLLLLMLPWAYLASESGIQSWLESYIGEIPAILAIALVFGGLLGGAIWLLRDSGDSEYRGHGHPRDAAIYRYISETSPAEESEAIDRHILQCAACLDRIESVEHSSGSTKDAVNALLPRDADQFLSTVVITWLVLIVLAGFVGLIWFLRQ